MIIDFSKINPDKSNALLSARLKKLEAMGRLLEAKGQVLAKQKELVAQCKSLNWGNKCQ